MSWFTIELLVCSLSIGWSACSLWAAMRQPKTPPDVHPARLNPKGSWPE